MPSPAIPEVTDGFLTAGDVLAPVFRIYIGKAVDTPTKLGQAVLMTETEAEKSIAKQIEKDVGNRTLTLLGAFGAEDAEFRSDVISAVFEESIEGNFPLASLRVTVHNVYDDRKKAYLYTDVVDGESPLIDYGKPLVLRMGYPYSGTLDRVKPVFDGIIVSIEASFPADGEPTVQVVAVDRRDRLRVGRSKRGRSFRAGSVEQLVADLAAEQGLRVAVTDDQSRSIARKQPRSGLTRPVHQPADQDALTFITDLCKRHALELTAFRDTVFVRDPGDVATAALRYVYRRGLISFTPRLNTAGRPSKVTVVAREPESGKRFEATADADTLKKLKLTTPESSVLERIRDSGGAGDRELVVTNFAARSNSECEQLAAGILKRSLDQTFTASGVLVGDPRVRVRAVLDIGGTGRWDGFYYVTKTTHRFGAGGYQTSFNVRRNRALPNLAELAKELE